MCSILKITGKTLEVRSDKMKRRAEREERGEGGEREEREEREVREEREESSGSLNSSGSPRSCPQDFIKKNYRKLIQPARCVAGWIRAPVGATNVSSKKNIISPKTGDRVLEVVASPPTTHLTPLLQERKSLSCTDDPNPIGAPPWNPKEEFCTRSSLSPGEIFEALRLEESFKQSLIESISHLPPDHAVIS